MRLVQKILLTLLFVALFIVGAFWVLASLPEEPEEILYGVTFSKFRADELQLDWKQAYDALIYDLGVRRLRLVAHWQMVEPVEGQYNFEELDYQMRRAEEAGASVILGVGRRLPSWPECHEPDWVQKYSFEEQKEHIRDLLTEVVTRYKDSPALDAWQVENEPFIIGFAIGNCGKLDIGFLDEEIALVKELDPAHPVLLTGSGELGLWNNTWVRGDAFGTTVYRRVWNRDLNSFIDYPSSPAFFRAKRAFTELTTGKWGKRAIIAELAAEPWVIKPVIETPLEEQFKRMDLPFFEATLRFAARTSFEEQYLWGAEWWYYLKVVHGDDSFWERARQLF